MVATAYKKLWPWERWFLNQKELELTPLPAKFINLSFLVCLISFSVLWITFSELNWYLLLVPILSRLAVLDLHTKTLPNIYTLPLLATGLAAGGIQHNYIESILGLALIISIMVLQYILAYLITQKPAQIGGGDIKLMLAIGAWLGISLTPFCLLLAGFITMPFLKFWPKQSVPFGVGLSCALIVFLLLALKNGLTLPI